MAFSFWTWVGGTGLCDCPVARYMAWTQRMRSCSSSLANITVSPSLTVLTSQRSWWSVVREQLSWVVLAQGPLVLELRVSHSKACLPITACSWNCEMKAKGQLSKDLGVLRAGDQLVNGLLSKSGGGLCTDDPWGVHNEPSIQTLHYINLTPKLRSSRT